SRASQIHCAPWVGADRRAPRAGSTRATRASPSVARRTSSRAVSQRCLTEAEGGEDTRGRISRVARQRRPAGIAILTNAPNCGSYFSTMVPALLRIDPMTQRPYSHPGWSLAPALPLLLLAAVASWGAEARPLPVPERLPLRLEVTVLRLDNATKALVPVPAGSAFKTGDSVAFEVKASRGG